MASAARSHLIARVSRVTLKTARVRVCARRNRKTDAAAIRFMTGRAIGAQVFGMIETRAETFQSGKTLDARRRMTDRAERMRIVGKLLRVTTRTRLMSGKSRSRRIIIAPVTDETRQPRVHRIGMLKSRKIFVLRP